MTVREIINGLEQDKKNLEEEVIKLKREVRLLTIKNKHMSARLDEYKNSEESDFLTLNDDQKPVDVLEEPVVEEVVDTNQESNIENKHIKNKKRIINLTK